MRTRVTVGLFVCILLGAGLAYGDTIGLYADPSGTSCNITVTPPFTLTYVYVVHVAPGGAVASEFMAPKPVCGTGATWIGDQEQFPCLIGCGDSQTGKTIGYGLCLVGSIHVTTIVYFNLGSSEACCPYPVLPHPNSPGGKVQVADCNYNIVPAVGLMAMVNGNATCPCGYPVPVEETTWGRIKSLYDE